MAKNRRGSVKTTQFVIIADNYLFRLISYISLSRRPIGFKNTTIELVVFFLKKQRTSEQRHIVNKVCWCFKMFALLYGFLGSFSFPHFIHLHDWWPRLAYGNLRNLLNFQRKSSRILEWIFGQRYFPIESVIDKEE